MDQLRAAFSLVPEYLRTLDREHAGPRLQRVPAAAGPPDAGAQALDAAALVRARRAASADRVPPRRGRAVRGLGRRRPRTGSGSRRSRSRPSASATGPVALAGRRDEPDLLDDHNVRLMDAVNRTGEVFLSHTRLREPVHDPRRDRQPAHGAAPRRAGVGAAAPGGRPPRPRQRRRCPDERADRDPVLLPHEVGQPRRVRRAVPPEPLADPARAAGRGPVHGRGDVHAALPRRRAARTGTCWSRSPTATGPRSRSTATRRSPRACTPTRRPSRPRSARRFSLLDAHWDVVLEPRPLEALMDRVSSRARAWPP